jgi:hypothetical protein
MRPCMIRNLVSCNVFPLSELIVLDDLGSNLEESRFLIYGIQEVEESGSYVCWSIIECLTELYA